MYVCDHAPRPVVTPGFLRRLAFGLGCLLTISRTPASGQAMSSRILDSLETIAVTSPDFRQRLSATVRVAWAGARSPSTPCATGIANVRANGVVRRLVEVYRRTQDDELRNYIVERMSIQNECSEAARFLASVAREPGPPRDPLAIVVDGWTRQQLAVSYLSGLGSWGVAELRTLYSEGSVREPFARRALEKLAARGFRPE